MEDARGMVMELLEAAGFRNVMGSKYCESHQSSHKNCGGCEGEQSCTRAAMMMIVLLIPKLYKPSGFDDFMKMDSYVKGSMKQIVDPDVSLETIRNMGSEYQSKMGM